MKIKEWKVMEYADCDRCGNVPEVYTESKEEGYFFDEEEVRCTNCGLKGCVSVDEDDEGNGIAMVSWEDFDI